MNRDMLINSTSKDIYDFAVTVTKTVKNLDLEKNFKKAISFLLDGINETFQGIVLLQCDKIIFPCFSLERVLTEQMVNFWYIMTNPNDLSERFNAFRDYSTYIFIEKFRKSSFSYNFNSLKDKFKVGYENFRQKYGEPKKGYWNDWSGKTFKEKAETILKSNNIKLNPGFKDFFLNNWSFHSEFIHTSPAIIDIENDMPVYNDKYWKWGEVFVFLFFFDITNHFKFKTFEEYSIKLINLLSKELPEAKIKEIPEFSVLLKPKSGQ